MNVRRRLIGGFVGIATFVLTLFSFVTYRSVLDLDSSENIKMLQANANAVGENSNAINAGYKPQRIRKDAQRT